MKPILRFIAYNRLPLGFGWLLIFFSSFGQTFFISLFVPHILHSIGTSKSAFGGYYALATITASVILLNFGNLVDTFPIGKLTRGILITFMLSLIAFAVSTHPVMLFFALTGLRLAGQGFLSHISLSTISRYFSDNRGKALSLTSLGYPIGEIIFPVLFTPFILFVGWRYSLILAMGFVFLLLLWMVRQDLSLFDGASINRQTAKKKWTYFKELSYSKTFWMMIMPTVIFAFTTTALFFYQYVMVEEKGWSLTWYNICFGGYAISRLITLLSGGILVDRWTARSVFPFYLLPAIVGLAALSLFDGQIAPFIFLIGIGISSGIGNVLGTAIIAEIYGTDKIGQVRSLFSMFGILSTAVAPLILGVLLDYGVSFGAFAMGCIIVMLLVTATSFHLKHNTYDSRK